MSFLFKTHPIYNTMSLVIIGYKKWSDGEVSIYFEIETTLEIDKFVAELRHFKDTIRIKRFNNEYKIPNILVDSKLEVIKLIFMHCQKKYECKYFNYDLDKEIFNINEEYFQESFVVEHKKLLSRCLNEYMLIQSIFPKIGRDYQLLNNKYFDWGNKCLI